MFQLVEITGTVNENGYIEIPVMLLEQTGIRIGDEVRLAYPVSESADYENRTREFLLARKGENPTEEFFKEENVELKLPVELLADAGIPADADLDIVCMDKKIVILPSVETEEIQVPEEVLDICKELGIPEKNVNIILRTDEGEQNEKDNL